MPVNPTHHSEALRLRTESLERLNLQIESERRDVGMLRRFKRSGIFLEIRLRSRDSTAKTN